VIEEPEDVISSDPLATSFDQDPKVQDPQKPAPLIGPPSPFTGASRLAGTIPSPADASRFSSTIQFGPQPPLSSEEATQKVLDERFLRAEIERENLVMKNLRESINTDYGAFREAKQIASTLGVSVDEVMNDRETMRVWAAERALRQASLENVAPEIAKMMEDRDLARDIGTSYIQFSYWERTLMAWKHGGLTFDRGNLGIKIRDGVATEEEKKQYDDINEQLKYYPPPSGEIMPEAFRFFGQQAEMLPYTIGAGLATGGLAAGGAAATGPGAVPAFFSGYFWGSNAASAYLMYKMEAGNSYMNMIESGMDPESAKRYSTYYGLVASAVEFGLGPIADVGVRRFVVNQAVNRIFSKEVTMDVGKAFFATPTARGALAQGALDYGKAVLIEPSEEWIQAKSEEMFSEIAKLKSSPEFQAAMRAEGNWEEKASQAGDAFYNAFWGMVVGGLVPGGMSAISQTKSIQDQAKKAQDNAQKLKDLIDHVGKSGLKDPNAVKEITTRLVDAHGPKQLGVTFGDLQKVLQDVSAKIKEQTGQEGDVRALLRQHFPEIDTQFEAASKVGLHGMILLNTDEFVTKVATNPSEFGTMLLQHLRVMNDGVAIPMSLGEAVDLFKKQEEMRLKASEIYEKKEAPFRESVGQVKKTVAEQLKANTNFSENEIATVTNLIAARATVFAEAEGILPMEWLQNTNASVGQVGVSMTQQEYDEAVAKVESLKTFAGEQASTAQLEKLEEARAMLAAIKPEGLVEEQKRYEDLNTELQIINASKERLYLANDPEYFDKMTELGRQESAIYDELSPLSKKIFEARRITPAKMEEIRQKTGWFIGHTGRWRYEIDDSQLKVNGVKQRYSDVIGAALNDAAMWQDRVEQIDIVKSDISEDYQIRIDDFKKSRAIRGDAVREEDKKIIQSLEEERDKKIAGHVKAKDELLNEISRIKDSIGAVNNAKSDDERAVKLIYLASSVGVPVTVGDILTHSDLFKAYPELRNIEIITTDLGTISNAYSAAVALANTGDRTIALNSRSVIPNTSELKSVLLHELQHFVQSLEGDSMRSGSILINEGFEAYWNDKTEVEAREVQARMNLLASERQRMAPASVRIEQIPEWIAFSSTPTQNGLAPSAAFIPHLNRIILSEKATLRDLLHEIGHFMFEDMIVNASRSNASVREVEIATTMLEWLGVVGDEKESAFVKWQKLSVDEKSARHEIFAYSWEEFVEKGNAPSDKLRKVFRYFSMSLRQFWRALKSDPRAIYKQAYGKDLPILTSPAAKSMAMMLSIEDDVNRHQSAIDMSTGFMTQEEALAAGVSQEEWNELMEIRRLGVSGSIDESFARRLKGAGKIRRMFGRFADRLNDQFTQIFAAVLGEEKAKLVKQRVYNARRWLATGVLSTDSGDVSLAQGAGENTHKLNRNEVVAVYARLKATLEAELKEVKAMRDAIFAANNNDAALADYDNYIAVIRGVIKIGSAPIMASASRILTVGRKGINTAEKAISTFVAELTAGVMLQNMRTVRRSPLYVFKDIRSLSAAKDGAKLSRSDLESLVYDMLVNDKFDFNIELKSIDAAMAGKREAEGIVWAYAKNRDQLFDAILIAAYKKALAAEKGKLTKKQNKKIEEAEAKYDGAVSDYFRFVKTQEEQARAGALVSTEEPTVKLHNALINAAVELRNVQSKVLKASVTKEKLEEINAASYEKLKLEFPEFAGEELKTADINAGIRDAVNRRLASKIVDKFFDSRKREMVSESGRDVAGYVTERGGFASPKDFIKAVVEAKSEQEVAQQRTDEQMRGKYRDAASNAHVTAGAKQVIESMVQEGNVSDALDGMLHDDGISLEFARTRFGYSSSEDMLYDLLTAQDIDEVAEVNAEARMQSDYAEITDPKERDRIISESVHNEMRAESIAAELQLVTRALRRAYDNNLPAAEREARQAVADEYARQAEELQRHKELLRERAKASRKAGDYATAQSLLDQIEIANKEIRKLLHRANKPLALMEEVRRAAREAAIEAMDGTLVRYTNVKANAVSASKARSAAKAALEKAMKAKGENEIDLLLDYIEHKHRELVAHYMIAEAHKAESQMRRDSDFLTSLFGNTKDIGSQRTIEYIFAARAVAIIFGLRSGDVDAALADIEKIREYSPALHAHLSMLVSGSLMMASKASQDAMQLVVNDSRTRPGPTVSKANVIASKDLYKNMTWGSYQELLANIRNLWDTAKKLESARAAEEARALEANVVAATESIIRRTELEREAGSKPRAIIGKLAFWRNWNKKPDGTNKYGSDDLEVKQSQTMDYFAKNERLESLFMELDNNQYGFFTKTFFRQVADNSVAYRDAMAAFNKRFMDILKPINEKLLAVGEIDAHELKDVVTGKTYVMGKGSDFGFSELFWFLQHIGNQGNYRRMIVGMGWGTIDKKTGALDDSKWLAFYNRMKAEGIITDEVLQVVQNIWNEFEALRPEFKRAWRESMGIPFTDVEATQVVGVNQNFAGGYMPAKYDGPIVKTRVDEANLDGLINDTEVGMLSHSPTVPLGRGLDRAENYDMVGQRLKVGHTLILSAMDEQLRFIHLHKTIKSLASILKDRRVSGALNAYNPSLMNMAIIPWLKDVALQSSSKGGPFAGFFRGSREVVVSATMFANVKAMIENLSGLLPVLNELGIKSGLPALLSTSANIPGFMSEVYGFAIGKSGWFRQNAKAPLLESYFAIQDLLSQGGKIGDVQTWMKKNGSFLNKLSQMWVSAVAWKASYDSDMAGLVTEFPDPEAREKEAIARADSRVRLTQGGYNIEDRTALERGAEVTKSLVALGSWANTQRLGAKRNLKQAVIDHGWIGGLPQMAGTYASIVAIPAIFSATVAAFLYDKFDDDDPEKRSEMMIELLALSQLKMISSGFPVIGNIATSIASMSDDKPYDDSLIGGAYVGVMSRAVKGAVNVIKASIDEDKDVSGKDLRILIDFILGGLRMPTVGRQTSYIYAVASGEEKPKDMREFILGFLTGQYNKDK
jgi:hypothetical protein